MRTIVHLDADAFFASVEQAADPRLRGKPVAVGGEKRGIVASASYEARRFGVFTPMPTARARKLCPKLIVLPGDFEKYERFSRWMFSYAQDFTPDVEMASIDEGYVDLTSARQPATQIASTIRKAIHDALKICVSEGIGSNKLVSQIASKLYKPAAFVRVPAGGEISFLHPLENRWLPGIGPKTGQQLDAAGLSRIGQIAATPVEFLSMLVGRTAPELKRFANGIDDRLVVSMPESAKSYSRQITFDVDTADEEFIEATLRRMTDDTMAGVRADGKSIRTITLKIRYNDMDESIRSESLSEPTDLESDVYNRLRPLLRSAWQRRVSLRMVSLKCSNIYDFFGPGFLPFEDQQQHERRRRLAQVVDDLRKRSSPLVVMRGHDLDLLKHKEKSEPLVATQALSRSVKTSSTSRVDLSGFVPLHVHSYYSFLDSTLSIPAIVEWARRSKCPAIALTDTNLHGAVEFCETAKAAGIKPIIGAEFKGELYFVENKTGYRNLCRLLTTRSVSDLAGLIVEDARRWRSVHYAEPSDRWKYDIIQSIRTLTLLRQAHPEKNASGEFHFPTSEELMRGRGAEFSGEMLHRARQIAERCNFEFDLHKIQFPAFRPPAGLTSGEYLERLVLEGAQRRYPASSRCPPLAQIKQELEIIREVGYEDYFLVVWDILQECQRRGIAWITRGSAADSLVCYCLGISDACPLRFGLDFRRFLNKERMAMQKLPDIDVDFAHDRKDDVVDLIFEKYGAENAAIVGGFSTYQGRSALADICKVLGVSEFQVRRFTEHIPYVRTSDLERAVIERQECRDLPVDEPPFSVALKMARFLDGFPRYAKMHPCGVVLSRSPMNDLTPCFRSAKGYPTTHFDMDSVEAIGLIKIDILAQGGLAAMRDVRSMVSAEKLAAFPGTHDAFDDPAVWEMIAKGEARAVHHIESPAMLSLCRMSNVHDIEGLIAIVSVIRPGAANEQKKIRFTRRYQGLEAVTYPHPSLESCLKCSFGMLVYEEQVLQICDAFAGMTIGKADVLRRALAKENWPRVEELGCEFADAARMIGRAETEIDEVWRLLCGFSGYAFCKAHSTAYGIEAYQSAWLKKYFPAEFMAAVLTNGKGFYNPLVYVLECHRLGIGLLTPWINEPGPAFTVAENGRKIRVPAMRIKGLSEAVKARIGAERARESFSSLAEFCSRVRPTKEEMELLMRVGAFDEFGRTRTAQFWEVQNLCALNREAETRAQDAAQQLSLFACRQQGSDNRPDIMLSEPSKWQRLSWENELLDFPVSAHPLELHDSVAWETYCPVGELGRHIGETVTCCGLIIEDRVHEQTTGEPMKFLTLADYTGIVETELFAGTYKSYGLATVRYPVLEITARVEPFENGAGYSLRILRAGKPRLTSVVR